MSQFDYFDLMFDLEKITGKNIDLVAAEKNKEQIFHDTNKWTENKNI